MESKAIKGWVNQHRFLHATLTAGLALIFTLLYFFGDTSTLESESQSLSDNYIFWIVLALALFGVVVGRFVFKSKVGNIEKSSSLEEKLNDYRSSTILKWALIEGPLIACILIYFFVDPNPVYIYLIVQLWIYFAVQHPTLTKISRDLQLSNAETRELESFG